MKKRLQKILVMMLLAGMIFGCSKKDEVLENKDETNQIEQSSENGQDESEKEEDTNKEEDNKDDNADQKVTSLPEIEYTVNDPNNDRGLSTERFPFSFGVAKNETPHDITVINQAVFDGFDVNALGWDNKTDGKVLYLTFDCGYKYEDLTDRILNTLKEKDVEAAFFCTLSFLKEDPEGVQRMLEEGHIVGNHSTTHPDCTTISRTEFAEELLGVNNHMRVNYGYDTKYFRFPTGAYSQNALDLANSLGYRSIFWSIAHADWDPENQPGVQTSFDTVTSRLHPGAVILLHSTSPDNADILGDLIDYARNKGYEFKSLDEYEYWTN